MQAGDKLSEFIEPVDGLYHPRSDWEHANSVNAFNGILAHILKKYSEDDGVDDKLWQEMSTPSGDRMVLQISLRQLFSDGSYLHIVVALDNELSTQTNVRLIVVTEHDLSGAPLQEHRYSIQVLQQHRNIIEEGIVRRYDRVFESQEASHFDYVATRLWSGYVQGMLRSEWDADKEMANDILDDVDIIKSNHREEQSMNLNDQSVDVYEIEKLALVIEAADPWRPPTTSP